MNVVRAQSRAQFEYANSQRPPIDFVVVARFRIDGTTVNFRSCNPIKAYSNCILQNYTTNVIISKMVLQYNHYLDVINAQFDTEAPHSAFIRNVEVTSVLCSLQECINYETNS